MELGPVRNGEVGVELQSTFLKTPEDPYYLFGRKQF
jgi:hypothetical protein